MTPQADKFFSLICGNASAVLTTITNNPVELKSGDLEDFDFERVSTDVNLPGVLLTLNFSGDQNFQFLILCAKKVVSTLADLMMLGDGSAEYVPEEHNDAMQEMFNQILGSLTAELSGQGVTLNGSVTQVELTDMEIQRDFLEDNKMTEFTLSALGTDFPLYLFMDSFAQSSLNNLFQGTGKSAKPASRASSASAAPEPQAPAVSVSRASFGDIDNSRPADTTTNVNIEMLHDITLPVTVELGRKDLKIKDVLELGQGSVIELEKTAGEYVDLIVNGKKFAVGEVMVADENYAVRIVSLVSRRERIKSLGK
jgi:flagellar motor switch protein FliN/FliY